MKVVPVRPVEFGAKRHAEISTCTLMHGAQELAFWASGSAPMSRYRNASAILEGETRNIDGIGSCVLASLVPPQGIAHDVSAGVGPHMLERFDPLPEEGHG